MNMYKQPAFYFDATACSGCKACQVACKDKHDLAGGVLWRRVYEVSGGDWQQEGEAWQHNVFSYHISMACNHCQEAICMHSCPNKAIFRDAKGLVLINASRCMGCRYCEWTCPYGALIFDREKKVMSKCTLCHDYIAEGKLPSCVSACPMRVLEFGELETLQARHGKNAEIFPLAKAEITQPSLVIKPHRDAAMAAAARGKVINKEEVNHGT
jgi:anaerobic dimethyl sulfoxide reductase subunit B